MARPPISPVCALTVSMAAMGPASVAVHPPRKHAPRSATGREPHGRPTSRRLTRRIGPWTVCPAASVACELAELLHLQIPPAKEQVAPQSRVGSATVRQQEAPE